MLGRGVAEEDGMERVWYERQMIQRIFPIDEYRKLCLLDKKHHRWQHTPFMEDIFHL